MFSIEDIINEADSYEIEYKTIVNKLVEFHLSDEQVRKVILYVVNLRFNNALKEIE